MPNVLIIGGILLILNALLHLVKFNPLGLQKEKGLLIFGVIYLILGILVLNFEVWSYYLVLGFTAVGLIAALATYQRLPVSNGMKIAYILIDITILIIFTRAVILLPVTLPQLAQ